MSFKKNVYTSYTSQIYIAVISIFILPLYMNYLGAEAYGLIGFFGVIQIWFYIFDLGLTPTISREVARYRSGVMSTLAYIQLLRAFNLVFISIAAFGLLVLYFISPFIAEHWLNYKTLQQSEVINCLYIINICITLKWLCGLYRGVLSGFEYIVWLSYYNSIISTLKFLTVFISLYIFGFNILVFFIHQLVVGFIEILLLFIKSLELTPSIDAHLKQKVGWSIYPLKSVLNFSMTISFLSVIWILQSQSDKLILSSILPLKEYGYYTLAVLIANGIITLSNPMSNYLVPRMSKLYADNDFSALIKLYVSSTQFIAMLIIPIALTLFSCAFSIIYIWTGNEEVAKNSSKIMQLYVLGNAFMALSTLPYYLQFAFGKLKYHVIGNSIVFILLVPSIFYFTKNFGAIAAGYIWLFAQAIYFIIWVPFVHHNILPNFHMKWLLENIMPSLIPSSIIALIASQIVISPENKIISFIFIIMVLCVCFLSSVVLTKYFSRASKITLK